MKHDLGDVTVELRHSEMHGVLVTHEITTPKGAAKPRSRYYVDAAAVAGERAGLRALARRCDSRDYTEFERRVRELAAALRAPAPHLHRKRNAHGRYQPVA